MCIQQHDSGDKVLISNASKVKKNHPVKKTKKQKTAHHIHAQEPFLLFCTFNHIMHSENYISNIFSNHLSLLTVAF